MAESKEELEYNTYMLKGMEEGQSIRGHKSKAAPTKSSLTLEPEAYETANKEYKKQLQPQSALDAPDATAPEVTSGLFPATSSAASGFSTQKPAEDMTEAEYNAAMAETQDTANKRRGPGAEYSDEETIVDEPGKVVPGSFSRGWYKTFGRGKTGFDALKSYNPEVEMAIRGGEEVYKSSKDDVWHRLDPHSYNPAKWVTDPGETLQDVGESAWDIGSGLADSAANTYARLRTGLSGQVAGPAASAVTAGAADVANQAIGNASGYASGYDLSSTALAAGLSGGLSSLMGGASKAQVGKHIDDLVARANKGDREALKDIQTILERNKMGSIYKVPEDGSPRTRVKPDAGDIATAKSSLQLDQRGILPLAKDVFFTKGGRPQHLETWAKEAPSPEYMKEVLETQGIQQPVNAPTTRRQLAVWTARNPEVTSERAMLEAGNSAATMKEALVEKYGKYFAAKDSAEHPTFDLSVITKDMDERIASLTHPTMTESEREVVRTLEAYKSKFFSLAEESENVSAFDSGILDFTGAPISKPPLAPVSQLVSHQRAFDLLNKAEAELSARAMSKTGGEAIAQRTLADVATTYKDYMYEAVLGPKLRNDFRKSISYRDTLKKYFRDAPTADKNSIGLSKDTAGNRVVMNALGEVDRIVREIETARGGIRKDPLTGKMTEGYSVGIVERIKQATIDNHLGNPTDVADYAGGESSNIVRALTMATGSLAGLEPLTAYTAGQVTELIGNRMKAPRMWNAQLAGAEKAAVIKKALARILDKPDKLPYGLGSVSKKAKYGMSKAASPWALIKNINTRNQSREEED